MAIQKWDVLFLDGSGSVRVSISALDEIEADRKAESGSTEHTSYKVWRAATREGKTTSTFEEWAATTAPPQPVYTEARIAELVAFGGMRESTADRIRATFTESGESPAPRTA